MNRVIKKYKNRKLYDTKTSKYITLTNIADMVKNNDNIQVICHNTKEDVTHNILTQVIANNSTVMLGNVDVLTKIIKSLNNESTKVSRLPRSTESN
jgi:polyhydroxyalkanoate synthesis repressor PhaR